MAEAVMSVVILKYGIRRSCVHERLRHMTLVFTCCHRLWCMCFPIISPHLNLFALEDVANTGVEGSAGEHGGDGIRQIQNLRKH